MYDIETINEALASLESSEREVLEELETFAVNNDKEFIGGNWYDKDDYAGECPLTTLELYDRYLAEKHKTEKK